MEELYVELIIQNNKIQIFEKNLQYYEITGDLGYLIYIQSTKTID